MSTAEGVRLCRYVHLLRLWILVGLLGFLAPLAQAQSCYVSGSSGLGFGTVSAAALADTQGNVDFRCQGVYGSVSYVRMCVYLPEGSPITGIAPRWMTNYSQAQMAYDIYADPARSQIVGPPPAGGGFPSYTLTLQVPDNATASLNIPLYGRVPAGQSLPAGAFQSQLGNAEVRWAGSTSAYPASCNFGGASGIATFYLGVTANFSNSCTIAIGQASDMDFGSVSVLPGAADNTSQITLACPNNTAWRVGLNDGLHAVVAGQRRMAGPAPDYLAYELYRDPSRTQRWGNDTAGGTNTVNGSGSTQTNPTVLTVYGRVPVQAVGAPGTYTDTITVTLSY